MSCGLGCHPWTVCEAINKSLIRRVLLENADEHRSEGMLASKTHNKADLATRKGPVIARRRQAGDNVSKEGRNVKGSARCDDTALVPLNETNKYDSATFSVSPKVPVKPDGPALRLSI